MPNAAPQHRPHGWQSDTERRARHATANKANHALYGHRWRKLRDAFLAKSPLCQCEANNGAGCGYPATVVDHKIPHKGDLALFYAWTNLEALAKACHDRKTATLDGGFGNPIRRKTWR